MQLAFPLKQPPEQKQTGLGLRLSETSLGPKSGTTLRQMPPRAAREPVAWALGTEAGDEPPVPVPAAVSDS